MMLIGGSGVMLIGDSDVMLIDGVLRAAVVMLITESEARGRVSREHQREREREREREILKYLCKCYSNRAYMHGYCSNCA